MIENLQTWILTFDFTSLMGFLLYWVPLAVCAYGYTVETFKNYQIDLSRRTQYEGYLMQKELTTAYVPHYYPTDTIGTIILRIIVSIIPVMNLWTSLFQVLPSLLSSFFKVIEKILDRPLVPKR